MSAPLLSPTGDLEAAADQAADSVMHGRHSIHVAGNSAPGLARQPDAGPKDPLMPTVSGDDKQKLVDVMEAVQKVKPSAVASGLYTTVFHGKEISLTQMQRDDLYKTARKAIRDNLRLVRNSAESAMTGFESQSEVDKQHYIVAPIVKVFGRVKDPGPNLLAEVFKARASADAAQVFSEDGNFSQAAISLADAEIAAIKAQKLWQAYFQGIIGSGEMTVTALEYTAMPLLSRSVCSRSLPLAAPRQQELQEAPPPPQPSESKSGPLPQLT